MFYYNTALKKKNLIIPITFIIYRNVYAVVVLHGQPVYRGSIVCFFCLIGWESEAHDILLIGKNEKRIFVPVSVCDRSSNQKRGLFWWNFAHLFLVWNLGPDRSESLNRSKWWLFKSFKKDNIL